MLTDEEIVDHVQHMGCEKMDVELIESDDDGVDMGPPKMTLVECRESLKGIANFVAQNACLGTKIYYESVELYIIVNVNTYNQRVYNKHRCIVKPQV